MLLFEKYIDFIDVYAEVREEERNLLTREMSVSHLSEDRLKGLEGKIRLNKNTRDISDANHRNKS